MANETTILWEGESGRKYKYWIYPLPPNFDAKPGNYIFAKETRPGYWAPIYIGQTSDLSERFEDHHAMPCAKRNGATHIHAHTTEGGESARLAEETDLVRKWSPVCNK